MFHIGQHVICVNADSQAFIPPDLRSRYTRNLHGLRKGVVYTVRGFSHDPIKNIKTLLLEEIVRPLQSWGEEAGYNFGRFRPLQKLSVDDFISTEAPNDFELA